MMDQPVKFISGLSSLAPRRAQRGYLLQPQDGPKGKCNRDVTLEILAAIAFRQEVRFEPSPLLMIMF